MMRFSGITPWMLLLFVLFSVNGLVSIAWAVLVSFEIYELVEGFLLLKKGLHTDDDLVQMGVDYFGFVAGVIVGGLVFLIAGC